MRIGIPKEIRFEENRVAAIPDTVEKFIEMGFSVSVETSAGEGILIGDEEYEIAGATIVTDTERLFAESDIILKVEEPVYNERLEQHEVNMLRNESVLISFLNPSLPKNDEVIKRLCEKKITAFRMDGIPEIPHAQKMNAMASMKMVSGYQAVVLAASHLPRFVPMIHTTAGIIRPAKFLIVGAGIAGRQAIVTANKLGGVVNVIDVRREACSEAVKLGVNLIRFKIPREIALKQNGKAKPLGDEWLEIERSIILPYLEEADIVILSARVADDKAPMLVTEQMLLNMKPGSIIVDMMIGEGGNCEVTECDRIIRRVGVCVVGIRNLPSRMPVHSTLLYSNNMYHFVEYLFQNGWEKYDTQNEIIRSAVITRGGKRVQHDSLSFLSSDAKEVFLSGEFITGTRNHFQILTCRPKDNRHGKLKE